ISLCAGVGGLDLGLHIAIPNYRTVCYVERDAYAAATLVARMENTALDRAPLWDDVKSFDGKAWRKAVDIIHGGYPCQPFSVAGRKLGDKDPRHLWPHIARIVRAIKPPICFFENVGGHLRLGFEQVHDDLRSMGYRVKAGLFTAAEVGASHKRERLFILAYRAGVFGERGFTQRDFGWESEGTTGSQRPTLADSACAGNDREARQFHKAQRRPDGSMLRVAHGTDNFVADGDSDGFSGATRAATGKDDPQGRTKRPAHAEPCRDGSSAARIPLHQAGSGKGKKRRALSGSESAMANATSAGTGQHKLGSRHQPDGGQQDMADTARLFGQAVERDEPDGTCGGVGDADDARLEGRDGDGGCGDELPAWPPGPSEHDEWERVPAHLKPAVCRMADGMAYRVDRLRLCGNGVVPLAAAYAFRTLAAAALHSIEGT
ncbi:MAG: DNA cytosine methyltransferase, partial [Alphaproteobacteria bacterium]|nr:DNA cytosine methyltransferase [Alphaproteobacteria bacterium]